MTEDPGGRRTTLQGRSVLIVEDRYLIAAELAEEVRRLGGEVVGPSPSMAAAERLLDRPIDVGLLDVNLDGELVFPLAETLARRGVPIVFLTGYDEVVMPEAWRDTPRLCKPVRDRALREELLRASS